MPYVTTDVSYLDVGRWGELKFGHALPRVRSL